MARANAAGPPAPDLSRPRQADSTELRRRIDAGEWVVDLRSRLAFAAGHVRGTLPFELGDNLTTYLGWLMPWGMPLTLLGSSAAEVAAAQRDVARICIDQVHAAAAGGAHAWAGRSGLAPSPLTYFSRHTASLAPPA